MTPSTTDPFGARVTAAASALTPPTIRSAVRFRWSPDGLVISGPRGTEGVVLRSRAADGPSGPDRHVLAAPTAALGAFVAAVLAYRPEPGGRVVARTDALLAPLPAARGDQWLGFHRVGDGWVSLAAVGTAQRELAEFGLADVRRRGLGPVRGACRLQSLGLASLPARAGGRSRRPVPDPTDRGAHVDRETHDRPAVCCPAGWQPLRGHRVLGLGRLVAGPHAANLLAAVGAVVTRVGAPGDRVVEPGGVADRPEEVDLRTPAGRRRVAELIARTDVLVENYRPRAWQQLLPPGVRAAVPRHVAVRGFPTVSPCRDWKVLGFMAEGVFGVGLNPVADGPGRVPASAVPMWDRVAGTVAAARSVALLSGGRGAAEVSLVGLARDLLPTVRDEPAGPGVRR